MSMNQQNFEITSALRITSSSINIVLEGMILHQRIDMKSLENAKEHIEYAIAQAKEWFNMIDTVKFFTSILIGIILGILFGLWQENLYAGEFMCSVSFLFFYFSNEE